MQRREFLDPHRLLRAAGQLQGVLGNVAPAAPPVVDTAAESLLLHFSRRAMATVFEIVLPFGLPHAHTVAADALDLIDALEDQLSVYREHSEVCRINREAATQPLHVETHLFDLLQFSAQMSVETKGAFDMAAGSLIKAWGFWRGPPQVPTSEEWQAAFANSGMQHVVLNEAEQTIEFRKAGVELNLGSIGKGYALDRGGSHLVATWGIHDALLQGGRSSVLALGNAPGSAQGWTVGVKHPWNEEVHLGMVQLQDQALGTSAATFKHLVHEGRKLGHILDPRTGWPASGVASATVVAPTAAAADALARPSMSREPGLLRNIVPSIRRWERYCCWREAPHP